MMQSNVTRQYTTVHKLSLIFKRNKKYCLSALNKNTHHNILFKFNKESFHTNLAAILITSFLQFNLCPGAIARLESVNRPDLLPSELTKVIDIAGFLTTGEENRIKQLIDILEKDTGIKLRLLAQNYPETPGLAIRDYWNVDDNTIVMVADPNFGGILNFNVGLNIDNFVPKNFWKRVSGKYGNKYYWQENGENTSILNAVSAIDYCLREPISKVQCSTVKDFD